MAKYFHYPHYFHYHHFRPPILPVAARRRATGLVENILTHRGEKVEIFFLIFAAMICVSDGEIILFFFVNAITFFVVLSVETEKSQRSAKKAIFLPKRAEGVTNGPNIETIDQKRIKCSLLTKTPVFCPKK